MAEVFKAMELIGDGREVAIKMFRRDVLNDASTIEAFRRETEAIRNCIHPNIVRLLESGVDEETGDISWLWNGCQRTLTNICNGNHSRIGIDSTQRVAGHFLKRLRWPMPSILDALQAGFLWREPFFFISILPVVENHCFRTRRQVTRFLKRGTDGTFTRVWA
jgi:serine/threonine protein kinase